MDGLLVFDEQNDIVFTKFNDAIKRKLISIAKLQELMENDADENKPIDTTVLMQLFSPIIVSQRIMFCQFDNSYTYLECENDMHIAFQEFLGFLFLKIGNEPAEELQKFLGICIAFVKHLCGPNLSVLKSNKQKSHLLDQLLNTWWQLYQEDESILVEGVEYLLVASELRKAAGKAMELVCDKLKRDLSTQRIHGLLLMKNKLLSIRSSRQAQEISPADLIFLQIYNQTIQPAIADVNNSHHKDLLFLQGNPNREHSGCIPHIIHITHLNDDLNLLILIEHGSLAMASSLFDVFFAVHKLRILQMQNDISSLKSPFDSLEHYIKLATDAYKKAKYNSIVDGAVKNFSAKWNLLRSKYVDFFKHNDQTTILHIESNMPIFIDSLKELYNVAFMECNVPNLSIENITDHSDLLAAQLLNASFDSNEQASSSIVKSVFKDINGLVHFVHVNRSNGRVIVPPIDTTNRNGLIIKQQAWEMIKTAQSYLQDGHLSLVWQDQAFYYSYFLWFEDHHGTQLKLKEMPNTTSIAITKPQKVAGILAEEFYHNLIQTCFPKTKDKADKIKCYELFTIYIALTTPHSLLDFNRRLVAILRDNVPAFYGLEDAF